jgi:RNA polymerase sigma factor (sigma-70 family)
MAHRTDPPEDASHRLEEFLSDCRAGLIRFLMKRGALEADAHDVVQICYLKLCKPGIHFLETPNPKGYLWTTALREWARINRRRRAEQGLATVDPEALERYVEDPEHLEPGDQSDALARHEDLQRAYASLTKEEKAVCNLMIEGMDAGEIVAQTGLSPDKVERRMTAVRKRLRDLI